MEAEGVLERMVDAYCAFCEAARQAGNVANVKDAMRAALAALVPPSVEMVRAAMIKGHEIGPRGAWKRGSFEREWRAAIESITGEEVK